jgi:hypothetical protein
MGRRIACHFLAGSEEGMAAAADERGGVLTMGNEDLNCENVLNVTLTQS